MRPSRRVLAQALICLAALFSALAPQALAHLYDEPGKASPSAPAPRGKTEEARAMPFNKTSVQKFFVAAGSLRQELEDKTPPGEWRVETAKLYADLVRRGGYDFEATVKAAMRGLDKSLDNPRFAFLAGVFQIHPDVYFKLRLISRETRDAVTAYFR